jgi:3-deoxy-manno-octulosonate cytidylyltransferase (CMP-KDO synthetase)
LGFKVTTLIVIPARLGSKRLPHKPLALIGGKMLIEHVWKRAVGADIGPVWVSTDSRHIVDRIHSLGGNCCERQISESCGTDRVADLAQHVDPDRIFGRVLNVQGDMPFVDPDLICAVNKAISDNHPFVTARCTTNHVVAQGDAFTRFTMSQHIGIYGFTRKALDEWSTMLPSFHEKAERLEGWRLIDNGKQWHFVDWSSMPLEVNTNADLDAARHIVECLK